MQRFIYPLLLALIFNIGIFAQPKLEIEPDDIYFTDIFDRIKRVALINEGNMTLEIDTVYYSSERYFLRFNGFANFPIIIQPDDTVYMDCILADYQNITVADTADTMYFRNNGIKPLEDLEIEIEFWDDDYHWGFLNGQITANSLPAANANVYVFRNGNYLITQLTTDIYGNYYAPLPPGEYTVAADRDSFYLTYFEGKADPFSADVITILDDSTHTINIELAKIDSFNNSISGSILDSLNLVPLRKGVIVVRKGTHTPNKIRAGENGRSAYAAIVNTNGTYKVHGIEKSDYYFVQSFSDFYVPAYYSESNISPAFWQQADSVFITGELSGRNISMARDSSYGGGIVSGNILINGRMADSLDNVVVYAQTAGYGNLVNYTLDKEEYGYKLKELPYGNYKLIAQSIGLEDAESDIITIAPGQTSVEGINLVFNITDIKEFEHLPSSHVLKQNYPNPFNPSTKIDFYISTYTNVVLKISNILGEEIAVLVKDALSPGSYSYTFSGKGLSSGTYFVTLIAGDYSSTKKILLLK